MKKISQIIVGTPNAKGKKNHYRSLNPRRPKTHLIISYKTEERKIRNYSNRRRTKNSKKSFQKKRKLLRILRNYPNTRKKKNPKKLSEIKEGRKVLL